MTDAGAALYGRAWVDHPPPKYGGRKMEGPPLLGSRELAVADSLGPERTKRIKDQAKLEAAAVMAAWERRTGRSGPVPKDRPDEA